jgi:hypothetical protein
MSDREPVRQSELLAGGYSLSQLRPLTEYIALDGEVCYRAGQVEELLGAGVEGGE